MNTADGTVTLGAFWNMHSRKFRDNVRERASNYMIITVDGGALCKRADGSWFIEHPGSKQDARAVLRSLQRT